MFRFFASALDETAKGGCTLNGGTWHNSTATTAGWCDYGSGSSVAPDSLTAIIGNVSNILFFVIGLIAVIILVYGGIQYIISEGNASKIERAKTTITWAIVGLIISIVSWAIVHFIVLNVVNGGGNTSQSGGDADEDHDTNSGGDAEEEHPETGGDAEEVH
ncbi:MAG: pilin [Candidatus Nomurabacteria bacterium]|jgi:hypothetical protein|nr:pilin [Candidatus Nomurabacteria bacterium]